MVSIARASLVYEWRRYLAALLSVTFAGLLVVVQAGLLHGLFRSVSLPVDRSSAQLWVTFPNLLSVDHARPVSSHADALARMNPAIERVERYSVTGGDMRRPDGVAVSIIVHAIDTRPDAMAFSRSGCCSGSRRSAWPHSACCRRPSVTWPGGWPRRAG